MKYLAGVDDAQINKITHENAMRLFRYDPYKVRPKEKCTVAALRAEATDVDTAQVSRLKHKRDHSEGLVDLGTVARTFGSGDGDE